MRNTRGERVINVRRSLLPLLLLAALLLLVSLGTAWAAASALYLKGNGLPIASLSSNSPSAGTLPNYDPGRDGDPGLLLLRSPRGLNETDPAKYQLWLAAPGEVVLEGPASLTFWSAMRDFATDKKGQVRAYLLDCASSGNDCKEISTGVRTANPWSSEANWSVRQVSLGTVSYTVAAGRSLAVKIVVTTQSHDDMWFAYDTGSYPSALNVQVTSPPPTTSTTTTTTTTLPTTTTTTTPSTTTTTTTPSTTTTTTTPSTTTTTTTLPTSTTTTTGGPQVSTTTTTGGPQVATTTTITTAPPQPTTTPPPQQDDSAASTTTAGGIDATALPPPAQLPEPTNTDNIGLSPLVKPDTVLEHDGFSGALLDGLELAIPPAVASSLLSPLLFLESILGAFLETGRGLLIPGLLLLIGLAWVEGRRRWGHRPSPDGGVEAQP